MCNKRMVLGIPKTNNLCLNVCHNNQLHTESEMVIMLPYSIVTQGYKQRKVQETSLQLIPLQWYEE